MKILLALALQSQVPLTVNRDSADKHVVARYWRLLKRVHHGKSGQKEDQQKLQTAAKENWRAAVTAPRKSGGPSKPKPKRPEPLETLADVGENSP